MNFNTDDTNSSGAGMDQGFQRYAIFFLPRQGLLSDFGAAWLGWDILNGKSVNHPDMPGLADLLPRITEKPRKYGFHATLKPPFRLREGESETSLVGEVRSLATRLTPVHIPALSLARLGRFLALVPAGEAAQITGLAGQVVTGLDRFRAPMNDTEFARRNSANLSDRQRQNLAQWGYPFVCDTFRFHMTLTGPLAPQSVDPVTRYLSARLLPMVPQPFPVEDLCVVGEDTAGRFHLIERVPMDGQ